MSSSPPRLRVLLATLGGLTVALGGCRIEVAILDPGTEAPPSTDVDVDLDGDGHSVASGDCDDGDPRIHPLARELCDAIDNNCDASIDDQGACQMVEEFEQQLEGDVLFVVDTTELMEPLLLELADGLDGFASHVAGRGTNTHLAVATMDASSPGLVVVGQRGFVAGGTDEGVDRVTQWLQATLPAAASDHPPRGRDATLLTLSPGVAETRPQSDRTGGGVAGQAADFRRAHLPLAMVFVSRHEDRSILTPSSFLDALDESEGPASRVAHAFVGWGGPCDGKPSEDGASYRRMASVTGGLVTDICAMEDGDIEALGAQIASDHLNTVHPLRHPVDTDRAMTLSVTLEDGTRSVVARDDYTVDAGARALVLHVPPPAGSTLSFVYEVDPGV